MLGVLGDLVEDVVVWVDGPLRHGTDSSARVFRRRGGSAANVAASFAAAGQGPVRFIGCVGNDPAGDGVVAELAGHGVDVRAARRGETGSIVVLIDEAGERTMLPDRGAALLLDDVPDAWLAGLTHLHVPAYSFDGEPIGSAALDAVRRVRRAGGTVSLDASSTGMLAAFGRERFLALTAELAPDLLFANREESAFLGLLVDGRPGPERARLAATTVVTKSGAEATTVDAPGRDAFAVPVPPVGEVRDLTGAGDAFAAGFLAGYLADRDLRAAAERGHACAAKVLASPGASFTGD
ncbi:PfkB family carbohydrate kinase [Kitasatospora sp. A2-31]|uniref:carbohydrate kinase family protein n=1 Tax=Kitasatospora sp. A2-31 TaxID=2916414 RepID=UPI001EEA9836|nr:PfkB family carbohydrate kinase [Kitasatospora sp. A2-31]MCG6497703.1 PfkB family carbohydrate kinase [Kitasatospora sp. A2-31]